MFLEFWNLGIFEIFVVFGFFFFFFFFFLNGCFFLFYFFFEFFEFWNFKKKRIVFETNCFPAVCIMIKLKHGIFYWGFWDFGDPPPNKKGETYNKHLQQTNKETKENKTNKVIKTKNKTNNLTKQEHTKIFNL